MRYEAVAYLVAVVVFFTPIPWGRWSNLVLFALTSTTFLALVLFWVEAPAVIMSAARLSGDAPWAEHFMNIMIASTLFWIAFARLGGLPTASRIPDWSFGIYIWHYPVMQTVVVPQSIGTATAHRPELAARNRYYCCAVLELG